MHPLVEVGLLGVDVPVEMDDADVAVQIGRHPADGGKPDRMVAAEHDGHHALLHDVRHRLADLVERFLQIARNGEDVTDVDHVQLLAQIDAQLVVVGAKQVGRAPDSLRTESGAGPVGGARVEWYAEDGHLGVVDLVHILDERTFQECPALAGEVRQFAADEGRDPAVADRRRGLEAEGQASFDLLALPTIGQLGFGLLGPRAFAVQRFRGFIGHGDSFAPSCR